MAQKRRIFLLLVALVTVTFTAAGAGSSLSPKEARNTIASIPGLEFDSKLVKIKSIDPAGSTGSGGAIVEAQFSTAFRLEKKDGWQVAEIRLGNGRWEDAELITTAIRTEKIKRTREQLTRLAAAIAGYARAQGYQPRAKDVVELTDLLVPQYINTASRTDLWGNYLVYSSDGQRYQLHSLGPDGKDKTVDDITLDNGTISEK